MSTNANRPVRRRKGVAHYSDDNPSTFTKKMKGVVEVPSRRPPERPSTSSNNSRDLSSSSRKRKSPPALPLPADDVVMSHTRIINPVFPIQELVNGSSTISSNSTHSVFLGGSNNHLPPKPTWEPLSSHVEEYDPIGNITWLSVRMDREDYAIVGDCRGAVALMRNATTITVIRTTSAAKRDQEREIVKRKVFPNAISQCAWAHDLIAVLTKTELECLSVETKTILWSMPVIIDPRKNNVQNPVLSLQKNSLLWTTGQWGLEGVLNGSLLLWESIKTTTDHAPTVLAPKSAPNARYLTALWEKAESSRSFFCVYQTNDETIELLRGHSVDTDIVVEHRQSLPIFGRNNLAECTVQQFDDYIFVSGRGIRMYDASNLTFVATYGENVQLHGKIVVWSRCCWLPAPLTKQTDIRVSKKDCWIEKTDSLAESFNAVRDYWLMGIPHPFKGPEELKSNLYVWQKDGASSFLKSISKGCTSDIWVNRSTWSTVAVSAETGNLKLFSDSTKSSFSGVMYPVGFRVITENIEYVEDEDELDQVLPNREKPMLGLYDEDPILPDDESSQRKESANQKQSFIDVMSGQDVLEDENPVICWPEAGRFDHDAYDPGSPKRNDRRYPTLPQLDEVKQEMTTFIAEEPETTKPKPAPGRKRLEVLKQASIDCQLQNTVNMRRGKWSNSHGSSLDPLQLKRSLEEKTLAMELLFLSPGQKRQHTEDEEFEAKDELSCPACLGRMTLHKCRKREMPIDYDALAREELARREREEAEKMRIKTERRKQAELKRREAKKKKKMEEERLRNEQIQADHAIKQIASHPNGTQFSRIETHHPTQTSIHSPSIYSNREIPPFPPTLKIDGNEVVPSTSLNPTDALSALAGLADSLSAQPATDLTSVSFLSNQDNYQGVTEGLCDSLSEMPSDLTTAIPSDQDYHQGAHGTQGHCDGPKAQLDSIYTILPVAEDEKIPEMETAEPQSSDTQLQAPSPESPEVYPDDTTVSKLRATSDILVQPSTSNACSDITFHTVPGSTMPIMSDAPIEVNVGILDDDVNSNSASPFISPVNCATAGVLTPSGLSAIAMLSETAARQAILDGEEKGLISTNGETNGFASYQSHRDDAKLLGSSVDVNGIQADSQA